MNLTKLVLIGAVLGAMIWLLLQTTPDRPTTYGTQQTGSETAPDAVEARDTSPEDRAARRAQLESSLRQKAGRL